MDKHENDQELPHDEIMTVTEIARYLKVSEKTILRMVQAGQFPGVKVSNQWRFVRAVVDDWLSSRMYAAPKKSLVRVIDTAPQIIPIPELVSPRRILLDIQPGDKRSVLRQLLKPLVKSGLLQDEEGYLERLEQRENVVSTAIGHRVAIPHVREPEDHAFDVPCIVLGICREGTDFDALDGQKTNVFAMPCASSEATYLRLLAKISLVVRKRGVVSQMIAARTKKEIMTLLVAADQELRTQNERSGGMA